MNQLPQVDRAFGAENRARLLSQYFESTPWPVSTDTAWVHVYSLLLWIDRTIGLAHCYESDKSQPGRPWYARSLRFHKWISESLAVSPSEVYRVIDRLFSSAMDDLALTAEARHNSMLQRAELQRAEYGMSTMPLPGEDLKLESVLRDTLEASGCDNVSLSSLRQITSLMQEHFGLENKRKNLVGEGFEDTLAELIRRIPLTAQRFDVKVRPRLHELPGFNVPRGGDKTKRVDLALLRRSDSARTLVSCKWSIRSDREEQFATDFSAYARLEALGESFDYVLITNEFDPARLVAACDARAANSTLFTSVVHVNTAGPMAAYSAPVRSQRLDGGMVRAAARIASGRLLSLGDWLTQM